uniref:Cytochrome P450 4B1 n=1 Tax=Chrysemys picta bellii TaxID=8478 RepID=A0A8C3HAY9_CHRPI
WSREPKRPLRRAATSSSLLLYLAAGFCLIYVLLKAIQLYRKRQQLLKAFESFPGPPSHWLYGHSSQVGKDVGWRIKQVAVLGKKVPHAYPRWIGGFMAFLIVNHPDYAKTVFGHGGTVIGGLLILHGPKWFQHRRLLTPGFHYDVLKPYVSLMAESTKVMLDKWERLITLDKSVELFDHVSLMTLDSIMKCAFSCHSNCQTDNYIKAVYDLTYLVFHRIRFFPFHNDFIYRISPQGRRFQEACRLAHQHTDKVIKERKTSLQDQQELEKIQKKKYLDFLDILLCAKDENGAGLSDEDLRAEVDTFMFEGHDTTASGISWLLNCMALYPEHQQRCREEIKEILGDRETIQWDDLGKMTYSTMCIKKSLRLYPPVPTVSRLLSKPITFPDGRTLPEGLFSLLFLKGPILPSVFDPMRFSPENLSKRHSHAFLPFAAGARNCIGKQFAMNELKVALALTLLRFELSPDPAKPPKEIPQVVLKSSSGIHLLLRKLP